MRIAASILFGTVVAMLDALAGDGWLTHRKAVDTLVRCPCMTRPSHCVTTHKSEVQAAELLICDSAFWVGLLSLLLHSTQI